VLQRTMRSVAEGCKNFAICHACVANGAGTAKKSSIYVLDDSPRPMPNGGTNGRGT
jgi:hypothetical protein